MTGWRSGRTAVVPLLLAGCLSGALGGTSVAAPPVAAPPVTAATGVRADEGPVAHRVLFRFADPAVAESSGAVDAGSLLYTANDSGSGPVLYAVDTRTGRTVGTTTYTRDEVRDVEALAPATRGAGGRPGAVWVGDIGDNLGNRDHVSLYRVRPGQGGAMRVDLTYPGGSRDAEALLVHPRSGRLFVVSKSVFGGTVYEARSVTPGSVHRLRPFAEVPGLVTDGAFFPDGAHVLLRGYGTASVYTFPDFRAVGSFTLPSQQQGEAVAIGHDGRILLTSEGAHAPVVEIELPDALAAVVTGDPVDPARPSAEASGSTPGTPSAVSSPSGPPDGHRPAAEDAQGSSGETGPGLGTLAAGALVLVGLAVLVRVTRRRP